MHILYSNIDVVAYLASAGVLREPKHISQHSAKFVIRGFSDLERTFFYS